LSRAISLDQPIAMPSPNPDRSTLRPTFRPTLRPTILVVDDEADNFDVIEILLYREDYNLIYAPSGAEAMRVLETQTVHLALIDWMMPQMDGCSLCQAIKANPAWRSIPLMVVTALNSKEQLAQCIAAGADDFLGKPVNSVELKARTQSLLRIKQQYDQLQDLLQLREDLTEMLVHDLRGPLTTIAMSCELFEDSGVPDHQTGILNRMTIATQRLQSMIDSVLMLAKLQADRLALVYQPIEVAPCLANALVTFLPLAAPRQISLVIDNQLSDDRLLQGDPAILQRVFDNLLSNALKFAPSGSEVRIGLSGDDQRLRVQVADRGRGIPDSLKAQLFEKFETGPTAAIGSPGGDLGQIGLGLAFCKLAIEAHGGTIAVHDNDPGALFQVELPWGTTAGTTAGVG
jgi:two-component system, sensor histidine kinase and response regulator